MKKNHIPTLITLFRMALIPVAVTLWTLEVSNYLAWILLIFIVAAASDWVDGFLARRWKVESPLGAMLDQISDKLLTSAYLIMLVYAYGVPVVFALILILRDLLIAGLREYLALQGASLPVSRGGKWKTGLLMFAIILVLVGIGGAEQGVPFVLAGHVLLAVACIVSVASALSYIRASLRHLRG